MVTQRSNRALSCCCIVAVFLMVVSDFRICAQPVDKGVDLETWEAPSEMKKAFPYYVSGLDYKQQTVFVVEYGKWNVRKYLENEGNPKALDTYADQLILVMHRWSKAERNLPHPSDNSTSTGLLGVIIDFEGYESSQLTHIPSLDFAMEITRKFVDPVTGSAAKMDYGYFINLNAAAKVLVTYFTGPIIGDGFSKMKTFGTDKEEWAPVLLEKIPKSSLPVEYGGYPSFKPLAVFR